MIDELSTVLGIKLSAFFAGFIGGVVSLRFIRDLDTWQKKVLTVFGGAFAANYLSPWIVAYFKIQAGEGGVAFATGLFAMSLAAAIIETIAKADVWMLIRERFGK